MAAMAWFWRQFQKPRDFNQLNLGSISKIEISTIINWELSHGKVWDQAVETGDFGGMGHLKLVCFQMLLVCFLLGRWREDVFVFGNLG